MSVMECGRAYCCNIMCGLTISGSTYICNDCHEELLEHRKSWPDRMSQDAVEAKIAKFMQTLPETYSVTSREEDTDDVLSRLIRDPRDD